MEIEEIKRLFFHYNCRLSFLLRDTNIDEDISNVIIENEKEWTNEFLKIQKREIVEAKMFSNFSEAYSRYKSACKSYYDIYELSKIIKDVFVEERFFMEATFIYYYDLIMGKSIVGKEMASYENLINYLKNNDISIYNKLVSEIEEVFSKETDALSNHCKELKDIIKSYINK